MHSGWTKNVTDYCQPYGPCADFADHPDAQINQSVLHAVDEIERKG